MISTFFCRFCPDFLFLSVKCLKLVCSFGERTFASPKTLAALRETPLSQLFLETDDSPVPIAEIYARAAEAKGVPEEELQRAILDNYKRIFTGGEYEGPGRTKGDK